MAKIIDLDKFSFNKTTKTISFDNAVDYATTLEVYEFFNKMWKKEELQKSRIKKLNKINKKTL